MALFAKKPKKSPEELQKEREENVAKTSREIRINIAALEKKKETFFAKVQEARAKGLREPEAQARSLLKQTMAAIKRQESMLMTLELAVESRNLAQLNVNFLESIGTLSDDILAAGKKTKDADVKKINDKYLHAVYESGQQKERIDNMISTGEYASAVTADDTQYSEFDDEIDRMLEAAPAAGNMNGNYNGRMGI